MQNSRTDILQTMSSLTGVADCKNIIHSTIENCNFNNTLTIFNPHVIKKIFLNLFLTEIISIFAPIIKRLKPKA